MTWASAVTAIKARFKANWSGTPIMFENGEDENNEPFAPPQGAPWVALEVAWTGGEFASVDGSLRRRYGHIWVHAFVPVGTGGDDAHSNAATAAAIFDGADFSGIDCEAAQPGGRADIDLPDGNWYGQSASIPFTYDEEYS